MFENRPVCYERGIDFQSFCELKQRGLAKHIEEYHAFQNTWLKGKIKTSLTRCDILVLSHENGVTFQ